MTARSLLAALAMPLFCVGCHKAVVESYRIPKEKDPDFPMAATPAGNSGAPMAGGGSMAGTAVPTAQGAGLAWTAPTVWKTKPGSAMRKGSYLVPGNGGEDGDLSITAFPGDVGGELANVNRWRGQVQLPPVSDGDLPSVVSRATHDGLNFTIADFTATGANPHRILGAIVPYGNATWFFKLSGPDAVVGQAKPAFLAFLQTVKPAATP